MGAEIAIDLAGAVADQRRGARYLAELMAELTCTGRTTPVVIENISTGGAGVRATEALVPGLSCHLTIAGQFRQLPVTVVWARADHAGLRFDAPVVLRLPTDAAWADQAAAAPAAALDAAHRELEQAIDRLEACAGTVAPDFAQVTEARWRLGQAERNRRIVAARLFAEAAARTAGAGAAAQRAHAALRRELDAFRTGYVVEWTPERVQAEWSRYRLARAEKCRRLRDSIVRERELFATLLRDAERP